jgi:hypothetical protein
MLFAPIRERIQAAAAVDSDGLHFSRQICA